MSFVIEFCEKEPDKGSTSISGRWVQPFGSSTPRGKVGVLKNDGGMRAPESAWQPLNAPGSTYLFTGTRTRTPEQTRPLLS